MSILRLTPIQLTPNAWRILIASCVIWPELFKEHNNQIILIHVFIKSESQGRLELSLMSGSEIGHHSQQALYPQEVEHHIFSSYSFFFFFFFFVVLGSSLGFFDWENGDRGSNGLLSS
jgi:hypothetical protein